MKPLALFTYDDKLYIAEVEGETKKSFLLNDVYCNKVNYTTPKWELRKARIDDPEDDVTDFLITECTTIEQVKTQYPEYFI